MNDLSTGNGRLAEAARFLRQVHEEKRPFNVNFWFRHKPDPECGTVACAFGWCAFHKSFNDLGLGTVGNNVVYDNGEITLYGLDAARSFFQLPLHMAEWFFLPVCYSHLDVTAEMVAARIERYLETGKKFA